MTRIMIIGAGAALARELTQTLSRAGVVVTGEQAISRAVTETMMTQRLIENIARDMAPKPWGQDRPYLKRKKGRS